MSTRTITTTATAQRKQTPDRATVEVIAIGEGDSVSVARTTARDCATTIRESVTAVSADQIRTVNLQAESTAEMFDPATDAAYQATEHLHIECVPEAAEEVVVEVTDAGGTVRTVQFSLHEEVHRQLQNEALTGAMERAQEKAELIAATDGLYLAGIQNVTTNDVGTGMESIVDEALASGPDTDVCPNPITISESVEVTHELTED
ncbi:SIMPL domain-containing protein [Natrarchaeobius chitinivorans]|uniref:DUF541 domain-containing protein n=1 Tax=Natrarchaeobius chitinivorans TaxID=1679083 RepID=A0A3N6MM75_NATCH|nr:SIMPL domain-containing protein [Natrarchaeobius chitinivorans]RQG95536.1 DUF541 domain-containing protein [Natrarchaeobius chitinivorans]